MVPQKQVEKFVQFFEDHAINELLVVTSIFTPTLWQVLGDKLFHEWPMLIHPAVYQLLTWEKNFHRALKNSSIESPHMQRLLSSYIYLGDKGSEWEGELVDDANSTMQLCWKCVCQQDGVFMHARAQYRLFYHQLNVKEQLERNLIALSSQNFLASNVDVAFEEVKNSPLLPFKIGDTLAASMYDFLIVHMLSQCYMRAPKHYRHIFVSSKSVGLGKVASYRFYCRFDHPPRLHLVSGGDTLTCRTQGNWDLIDPDASRVRLHPGRASNDMLVCFTSYEPYKREQHTVLQMEGNSTEAVRFSKVGDPGTGLVRFGPAKALLINEVKSSTASLRLCGAIGPVTTHCALLQNLTPGRTYYYQVFSETMQWSSVKSFTMAPAKKVKTYALVGDIGLEFHASWSTSLQVDVEKDLVNGLFFLGDIVYELSNRTAASGFFSMFEPITSRVPLYAVAGNHDAEGNYAWYKLWFYGMAAGAGEASGSNSSLYWSVNDQLIHFVGIDSYMTAGHGVSGRLVLKMLEWLEADLARAVQNRANQPWIVVLLHSCYYASFLKWERFAPVFAKYPVDMFFCGHRHEYVRSFPTKSAQEFAVSSDPHVYKNPQYPTWITAGTGGNTELKNGPKDANPPATIAFQSAGFGYVRLTAYNRTHLYSEFVLTDNVGPSPQQVNGLLKMGFTPLPQPEVIDYLWIVQDR